MTFCANSMYRCKCKGKLKVQLVYNIDLSSEL